MKSLALVCWLIICTCSWSQPLSHPFASAEALSVQPGSGDDSTMAQQDLLLGQLYEIIHQHIGEQFQAQVRLFANRPESSLMLRKIEAKRTFALSHTQIFLPDLSACDISTSAPKVKAAFDWLLEGKVIRALDELDNETLEEMLRNAFRSNNRKTSGNASSSPLYLQTIEAYLLKARLSIVQLDTKEAEKYYMKVIYLDGSTPSYLIEFAHFLLALNFPERAEALLMKVKDLDPTTEQFRKSEELQDLLKIHANDDVELSVIETDSLPSPNAIEIGDNPLAIAILIGKGKKWENQKDWKRALEAYEKARNQIGVLYERFPPVYQYSLNRVNLNLARVRFQLGELPIANKILSELVDQTNEALLKDDATGNEIMLGVHLLLAEINSETGNPFEAENSWKEVLEIYKRLDPQFPRLYDEYATEAEIAWAKWKRIHGDFKHARSLLESSMQRLNEPGAIQTSERKVTWTKILKELYALNLQQHNYGETKQLWNDIQNVSQELKNASHDHIDQTWLEISLLKAQESRNQSKPFKAIAELHRTQSIWRKYLDPMMADHSRESALIHLELGKTFLLSHQYDSAQIALSEAKSKFINWMEKHPTVQEEGLIDTWLSFAEYHLNLHEYNEAEIVLLNAQYLLDNRLASDQSRYLPFAAKINLLQAKILIEKKQPQGLVEQLKRTQFLHHAFLKLNTQTYLSNFLESRRWTAKGMLVLGESTKAIAILDSVRIAYMPLRKQLPLVYTMSWATSSLDLAKAWRESGNPHQASLICRDILLKVKPYAQKRNSVFRPFWSELLHEQANAFRDLGQAYLAQKGYQESLKIQSQLMLNNPSAYEWEWAQTQFDYAEWQLNQGLISGARASYQKSIEVYENIPPTYLPLIRPLLSLGLGREAWCLLLEGNYDMAASHGARAYTLDQSDQWNTMKLGPIYLFYGKFKKAKGIYKNYMDQVYRGETFRKHFLRDLDYLQQKGFYHKDVRKIRNLLTHE